MMAVAASQEIAVGDVVVVGLGLPQIASLLAKRTHAPGVTLVLGIGVLGVDFLTNPGRLVDGRPREEAGLQGLGTSVVVTDRAVLDVTDAGLSCAASTRARTWTASSRPRPCLSRRAGWARRWRRPGKSSG
jgi:acyl CoA:acetate/3-ketoacid CoA transferase beta subunit